jgi:c-di-GMP-binding flagellar brake protein YcgR
MALISYPKEVYTIHLRRSPRIKVFLRAEICGLPDPSDPASRKAVILDISRNGCLLLVDLKMLLGKQIWLRFHVPWTGDRFLIQGRVIRCEATREGFQSGIEFLEMDEGQKGRFQAFLRSLEEGRLPLLAE